MAQGAGCCVNRRRSFGAILTPVGRLKKRPGLHGLVAALHQLAARGAMTKKS